MDGWVALFPLHTMLVHAVMSKFAPFYQAFDTFTKHAWSGRATSLVTQPIVLPAYGFGNVTFFHHTLGAYIAADTLHMMLYLRRDILAWIHHIATLGAYALSSTLPANVTERLLHGTFFLELSNPLVHIAWFLNKAGYSAAGWYKYLAGTTIVNYFVTRCVLFPKFVMTEMPTTLWPIGAVFIALNFIWFVQLIRYAMKVLRKPGGSRLVYRTMPRSFSLFST